jgi:hypothetical protein
VKRKGERLELVKRQAIDVDEPIVERAIAVRMAIGQLADYRRVDSEARCKVLLPEEPIADLVDLLDREGISILVPTETGFRELGSTAD